MLLFFTKVVAKIWKTFFQNNFEVKMKKYIYYILINRSLIFKKKSYYLALRFCCSSCCKASRLNFSWSRPRSDPGGDEVYIFWHIRNDGSILTRSCFMTKYALKYKLHYLEVLQVQDLDSDALVWQHLAYLEQVPNDPNLMEKHTFICLFFAN